MGWGSGSALAEELWSLVRNYIADDKRKAVAKKFMRVFEQEDCDTMQEAEQLCVDAGMPKFDKDKCEVGCNHTAECAYHAWWSKR